MGIFLSKIVTPVGIRRKNIYSFLEISKPVCFWRGIMVGRVPFSRHRDRKAIQKNMQKKLIWLVVWNIFIFTPSWGKDPIWLLFFKGVINHQQVMFYSKELLTFNIFSSMHLAECPRKQTWLPSVCPLRWLERPNRHECWNGTTCTNGNFQGIHNWLLRFLLVLGTRDAVLMTEKQFGDVMECCWGCQEWSHESRIAINSNKNMEN